MQAVNTKQVGHPRATAILLAIAILIVGALAIAVTVSIDTGQSQSSVSAPSQDVTAYWVPEAGEGLIDTARVNGVADSSQKILPHDRLEIAIGRDTVALVKPKAYYHPGMGEGLTSEVGDRAVLQLEPVGTSDHVRPAEWDAAAPEYTPETTIGTNRHLTPGVGPSE